MCPKAAHDRVDYLRRLLARVFFDRLFENELFSSSASASGSVLWLLAALASPGVMMSGSQLHFYAHARTFAPDALDRIMFVSQADRRDALVLGPLPVGAGEQARARLSALTWRLSRARRLRDFVYDEVDTSGPTTMDLSSARVQL